jgi:hypothetical protein
MWLEWNDFSEFNSFFSHVKFNMICTVLCNKEFKLVGILIRCLINNSYSHVFTSITFPISHKTRTKIEINWPHSYPHFCKLSNSMQDQTQTHTSCIKITLGRRECSALYVGQFVVKVRLLNSGLWFGFGSISRLVPETVMFWTSYRSLRKGDSNDSNTIHRGSSHKISQRYSNNQYSTTIKLPWEETMAGMCAQFKISDMTMSGTSSAPSHQWCYGSHSHTLPRCILRLWHRNMVSYITPIQWTRIPSSQYSIHKSNTILNHIRWDQCSYRSFWKNFINKFDYRGNRILFSLSVLSCT